MKKLTKWILMILFLLFLKGSTVIKQDHPLPMDIYEKSLDRP